MTALIWDAPGEHLFETGLDHGVLYPLDQDGKYGPGVVWNGLTAVSETPSGAEATPLYADNIKYLTLRSLEEFGATLEAFTYPDAFAILDGTVEIADGAVIGQQTRGTFGLVYRTKIGNDVAGDGLGFKLHLLYGLTASPSEKAYQTINDSPEAITFSWELASTPVAVTGHRPTSYVIVDSTKATPSGLAALMAELFGTQTIVANLPLPNEVITLLETV